MPKRAQYRRIESHAIYTVDEIVTQIKTSKLMIKKLVQQYGLPVYTERSVTLVHGADLKTAFAMLYESKKTKAKPHEGYCLRCTAPRRMRLDSLGTVPQSEACVRITGNCERCGSGMHRITKASQVEQFTAALRRSYNSDGAHCPPESSASDCSRPGGMPAFPARSLANLRVRRNYMRHLKGGKGFAASTIASYVGALEDYDAYVSHRDYKTLTIDDTEGFRTHLRETISPLTGKPLSLQSILQKLGAVQAFFVWLSSQEGYRRVITVNKYEQLSLTRRELAITRIREPREVPSLEEVEQVLAQMPANTAIEKRDRGLVAFLAITGVRVMALTTLQLKHVNLAKRTVRQDPRDVHTKFGKDIMTTFFPVSPAAEEIFADYVMWLRGEMRFKPSDPLFPQSKRLQKTRFSFTYDGLDPRPWQTAQAPRRIVNRAFEQVGCPAYGPHAFRHMIIQEGNRIAQTPEEVKAWSQNIGHSDVRTSQNSYGTLNKEQQVSVIERMRARAKSDD